MAFTRDSYYSALYQRLQAKVDGIETWSRRDLHFSKLPSSAQPALLMLVTEQVANVELEGLPTTWTLNADLVVLARANNQEDNIDAVLNALVDKVEAALLFDPVLDATPSPYAQLDTKNTTLGGLVASCGIAGAVSFIRTDGGDQCWATIPVEMVVHGAT